jgi:hypothetical protein
MSLTESHQNEQWQWIQELVGKVRRDDPSLNQLSITHSMYL